MLAQRSLAISMLVLALLGFADGWRLQQNERGQVIFDEIGPDRYLMGLGVLLAILAVILLMHRPRIAHLPAAVPTAAHDSASAAGFVERIPSHVVALAALIGYAASLSWLGYVISTALFMAAAFRIAGVETWIKSASLGVVTTALSYAIFVKASELSLPVGKLTTIFG